jgi:hypothetical protein
MSEGEILRAQPPTGVRPPPPGDFKHLVCQSAAIRGAALNRALNQGDSRRSICGTYEQKRPCTYCSHALIFCEAFRARIEQSIILTDREQNHLIARSKMAR